MAGRRGRTRPLKLVDDMVTVGARELASQLKVPDEVAKEVMRNIAHQVCFLNAGCLIYVPENLDFVLSKRDEQIWAAYQEDGPSARKFSAARVEELAQQHELTEVQIYNIIRLMKRREVASRQGTLPGLDPA